jgi:hypothetical protein
VPYGQPQWQPEPPKKTTNGFSIAALVLGICWVWGIGSILALVFGYIGKSQIDKSQGRQGGRGMAVAGIVLGWIGIGLLILWIVLVAVAASHSSSDSYSSALGLLR